MADNLPGILLIDDDSVDIQSLQRGFQKNNMSNPLFIANDGIEALDKLRGTNGMEKIVPMHPHHSSRLKYAKDEWT